MLLDGRRRSTNNGGEHMEPVHPLGRTPCQTSRPTTVRAVARRFDHFGAVPVGVVLVPEAADDRRVRLAVDHFGRTAQRVVTERSERAVRLGDARAALPRVVRVGGDITLRVLQRGNRAIA